MPLFRLDVNNLFLSGFLDEEVSMAQPSNFGVKRYNYIVDSRYMCHSPFDSFIITFLLVKMELKVSFFLLKLVILNLLL